MYFNNKLDGDEQITAEEMIASMIFNYTPLTVEDNNDDLHEDVIQLCEESCSQLGRDILLAIINQFRPDLTG